MVTLSVIIPTYNSEKTIRLTLESVREIADEIIIIDGGSIDRTIEIAEEYGCIIIKTDIKRFDLIRNLGINTASSEYILSLDSDDYVTKDCRKEIVKILKKPSYDVYVIPRVWVLDGKPFHIGMRANLFKKTKCKYRYPVDEELYCNDIPALKTEHGILSSSIIHFKFGYTLKQVSKAKKNIFYFKVIRYLSRANAVKIKYGTNIVLLPYLILEILKFIYRNIKIFKNGGFIGLLGLQVMINRILSFIHVSVYSTFYTLLNKYK